MSNALSLLISEKIPEQAARNLLHWYERLVDDIIENYNRKQKPEITQKGKFLLAISGSQGSGKSTLAYVLPEIFRQKANLIADGFSLDDCYKTKAERMAMARKIHPLFLTRGVPGTHDLSLAEKVIDSLFTGQGRIPAFEKSKDDRADESAWRKISVAVDIVIVEGWCMGCPPESEDALILPVNELEANEDPDGKWRREINGQLEENYRTFFSKFDYLASLLAPGFDVVFAWRKLQEEKLREKNPNEEGLMGDAQLSRFIQHYERLTRHMLRTLPGLSDAELQLNRQHGIIGLRCSSKI